MQGTCRTSIDMQGVAAASCTLLQQMSQDLLDRAPGELNSGCDSSDCLICQGQRQFCNQAITNTWLGARRTSSSTAGTPACSSQLSTVTAPQQSAPQQQPQQRRSAQPEEDDQRGQRKRPRVSAALTRVGSTGEAASTATAVDSLPSSELQQEQPHQQHAQQQELPVPVCSSGSPILQHSSSASWQWQPEFAALDGPAPARFVQAARLQPPADATPGHCPGRCDRISGLEFSPDGQLVAAAGVSKEVALYPLAPLAELQDEAAEPAAALLGCLGSCSSSQRRERMQQSSQQQTVPLLPPVATVRLPGKVSSIAFSPDMQGVISIGDYDGTLTQVHVASGHYLNEVDAHAGRRIWSVCHSKLRRHFAATASDDCTARLWSGSGLNTHVATITAPGRPAVCGADFSSSDEHLLALAAADARVYLYDMRQLQQPLATLHGHRRPVAYAKFFGSQQLVSASIDGTLAVWDLGQMLGRAPSSQDTAGAASTASAACGSAAAASGPSPANSTCCSSDGSCWKQQPQQAGSSGAGEGRCSSTSGSSCCTAAGGTAAGGTAAAAAAAAGPQSPEQHQPWKVFRGHTNEKNFVGLAVDPCSGLLAVGSETPEVFSYHTSWSSPLAVYDMAVSQQSQQQSQQQQEPGSVLQQMQQPTAACWGAPPPPQQRQQQSVSAVAWQPGCCATAARAGCGVGGCAPSTLLAAATSAGACMLLSLQHPS